MHSDIYLFAEAILKEALVTGFGVWLIGFLVWRKVRMKMTIESTTKVVSITQRTSSAPEGIQCRVWEGVTERGVKVQCLIPSIAVALGEDQTQFEAELQEQRAPSAEVSAFPRRMVL
jgi:hypothetical protein